MSFSNLRINTSVGNIFFLSISPKGVYVGLSRLQFVNNGQRGQKQTNPEKVLLQVKAVFDL